MAQVVEAHTLDAQAQADPSEPAGDGVGMQGPRPVSGVREDEPDRVEPPAIDAIDERMTMVPASKSTPDQPSPQTSPRRAPVAAMTRSRAPSSGSCSSAATSRARTSAMAGGVVS